MLRTLILRDGTPFSVSDLMRIAGPGNGATQRILNSFEAAGIVIKSSRGNQRLYRINHHPIYPELRSICLKTFGLADVIAKELHAFGSRIDTAFVFGSLAKSEEKPDSDIDLMVVREIDHFELGEVLERLEVALGRKIDLNLYSCQEWKTLQGDRVISTINIEPKITVM